MSEVAERYRVVADGFTRHLGGVASDGWSATTPCPPWTVSDLVAHVISTHRRVIASLDAAEAVDVDPGSDLAPQWRAASDAITAALADPSRSATVVSGMFGERTFETLVGRLVCADTLIHTWDLARATGQDETLDADAVSKALEALTPLDESIRRPGGFAAKIVPAPGADAQTRFLNFCGRAP